MPKKEKKPKSKSRKIVEGILTGITLALLGFAAASLITGMIFKVHTVPMMFNTFGACQVLTESMEPVYPVKSTIIVQRCSAKELIERFDKGETVDVTFFNADIGPGPIDAIPDGKRTPVAINRVMTHRMIAYYIDPQEEEGKGKYLIFTEGINAKETETAKVEQYQVFDETLLIGRVIGKSQFLGFLTTAITSVWGLLIMLLIPSCYMIVTSVLEIFKYYKDPEEEGEKDVVSTQDGTGASSGNAALEGLSQEDIERLKKEMLDEMLNGKKGDK